MRVMLHGFEDLNFYRLKCLLILLCACIVLGGCSSEISETTDIPIENIEILKKDDEKLFWFSDEYLYIGSYELVKQYEEAGGEWYAGTEDIYDYAWAQCMNVWNSYISLYETSHDIRWLEKLSMQIDETLDKRDIITGQEDRNGYSLPSWSYTTDSQIYKPYHNPVMIGLIVYPMLRFVEVVKDENIKQFEREADYYLQASIDALSVLDAEVNKFNSDVISREACQDLWRERRSDLGVFYGYYIGHLYYAEDYFKERGYVDDNPLPYNQCLAVTQCFPVLYRILGDTIWKEKTEKAWNWFKETGIDGEGGVIWWYYSEYYNWCRDVAQPIRDVEQPENGNDYFEDYEGHYSIDLMFIIEAHKIGIVNNESLKQISKNKMNMGLSQQGWPRVMNISANEEYNLKAAVYFDYFVQTLNQKEYIDIVFPVLRDEMERQYSEGIFASNATKINGTCLRLLSSAYAAAELMQ